MNRKMDNGLTRKMDKRFAREWIQKQTKLWTRIDVEREEKKDRKMSMICCYKNR